MSSKRDGVSSQRDGVSSQRDGLACRADVVDDATLADAADASVDAAWRLCALRLARPAQPPGPAPLRWCGAAHAAPLVAVAEPVDSTVAAAAAEEVAAAAAKAAEAEAAVVMEAEPEPEAEPEAEAEVVSAQQLLLLGGDLLLAQLEEACAQEVVPG